MSEESAAGPFDLDAALESAYASTMEKPEEEPAEPITEAIEPEERERAEEITDQGDEPDGEPDDEQPLTPPDRWSAERKATFAALPREAQKFLLDREGEIDKAFTQKTQELAEQRKNYEGLEQIIGPRRQQWAQVGAQPEQMLAHLFQLSDMADSDPVGFIRYFAQQRGVDLQSVMSGEDEYIDPATKQLTTRLQSVEQMLTSQQQQQEQQRIEAARSEIAAFREEKGENGEPLHPHFEEVRQEIASLMQTGTAKTLKHAYEMAVWANPSVRDRMMAQKQEREKAERLEAAKKAAKKAEKAQGVTVKSRKAGESAPAKSSNWESTLSEKAEELYGAA